MESAAAVARSRTLSLEGALRVKEREIERLTRLSEAVKVRALIAAGWGSCMHAWSIAWP